MELYQLAYFNTLCRYKHFTNAANHLYITPSALTTAIKRLERELNCKLVDREEDEFRLTVVGEKLLETSERVLAEVSGFERWLENNSAEKRVVKVGIEVLALSDSIVERIAGVSEKYPDIEVWLKRHSSANIEKNLLTGELDVGFMIHPGRENPELQYLNLRQVECGLVLWKEHPWAKSERIDVSRMKQEECRFINLMDDMVKPLEDYFGRFGLIPERSGITSKNIDYVKKLVERRLGMAVLPLSQNDGEEKVAVVPFDPPLTLEFSSVVQKGVQDAPQEYREILDIFKSEE